MKDARSITLSRLVDKRQKIRQDSHTGGMVMTQSTVQHPYSVYASNQRILGLEVEAGLVSDAWSELWDSWWGRHPPKTKTFAACPICGFALWGAVQPWCQNCGWAPLETEGMVD